jgi:hypothetical protein
MLLTGLLALASPPTEIHNHQPETVLSTQAKMAFRGHSTTVDVRVQKPVGQAAFVRLLDRHGDAVHVERVARRLNNAHLRLHLHQLEAGAYHLVVTDHAHRTVLRQEVAISTGPTESPELAVTIP